MSYQALYRVWRPQRFLDLVGQEHVTQTLTNALKESQFSHAYLFSGPRGTGKTSAAKIFAKAVNCENGKSGEPCNQCVSCMSIQSGSSMDVVEIDAASNRGVDEIRDLRENVRYAPTDVRFKVYIIDEVHMLTTEAFNALLKTLEEPPEHVIFILATTEPHKLLPTILSRCQRFHFRRIPKEQIVARLQMICEHQQITFEKSALWAIARLADGGMRDALSMLDQAISFGAGHVSEETILAMVGSVSPLAIWNFLKDLLTRQAKEALEKVDQFIMDGLEVEKLVQDTILMCRDLLLSKARSNTELEYSFLEQESSFLEILSIERISTVMDELLKASQQLKWTAYPKIYLEMMIIQLAQEDRETNQLEQLRKKLRTLEERVDQLSSQPSVQIDSKAAPKPEQREKTAPSTEKIVVVNDSTIEGFSEKGLEEVKRAWSHVLQRIKEEKITVHAWFVDGEPVAIRDREVLVAFRSKIHRDTTEKSTNKQLIERVLQEVFQKPMRLKTVLRPQWEQYLMRHGALSHKDHEKDQLPTEKKRGAPSALQDDIVKKAKELFGEEIVEVQKNE